jgi:hypothetical protein
MRPAGRGEWLFHHFPGGGSGMRCTVTSALPPLLL